MSMNKQFETQEQWNNFLDNVELKDVLIKKWQTTFFATAQEYFSTQKNDEWSFTFNEKGFLHWYITTEGDHALSLVYNQYGNFAFYCDRYEFNIDEIAKHLKTDQYNDIIQNVYYLTANPCQLIAHAIGSKCFSFRKITMDDFLIHYEQKIWQMGNKTNELLYELNSTITSITLNQEKTNRIKELCISCKI